VRFLQSLGVEAVADAEIEVAVRERAESYWRNKAVVDPSATCWTRLPNQA